MFLYLRWPSPTARAQLRLAHCPILWPLLHSRRCSHVPSSGALSRVANDDYHGCRPAPRRQSTVVKAAPRWARHHSRCSTGVCGLFGPGRFNECVSECESGKISLQYLPVRHLISSIPRKFSLNNFFSHLIVSQQRWSFLVFILQKHNDRYLY